MQARPIVEEVRRAVDSSPTAELIALIERAIGHVVKVILKEDDSNGMVGDLARELLDLHARACDAGNADPVKLARWMVRFRVDDRTSSRWTRSDTPTPWVRSDWRPTAAR